jgi:hypothetical protein
MKWTDGSIVLCEVVIEFLGSDKSSLGKEFCDAVCLNICRYLNNDDRIFKRSKLKAQIHEHVQVSEQVQLGVGMTW